MSIALAERFWSKVAKAGDDECWPWVAGCDRTLAKTPLAQSNRCMRVKGPRYLRDRLAGSCGSGARANRRGAPGPLTQASPAL